MRKHIIIKRDGVPVDVIIEVTLDARVERRINGKREHSVKAFESRKPSRILGEWWIEDVQELAKIQETLLKEPVVDPTILKLQNLGYR